MSRLTRDGTAEPSRETKFSGTHGDRRMLIFPVQLTTSRIGNLTRLIHTLLYVMTIHRYIHAYILRSPLLHNPGVHAGALGFNPMLLPKLDRREIPRSRDRGNSYRSNPGSPSIRGSGSCLRLCRVVFACYTPTGGFRPTPAGAGQGEGRS